MQLKVPFFKQTTPLNCGPTALKMVITYFGKEEDIETLEKLTKLKEGKALFTIQLATAVALLGFKTDFYSKEISFNEEHLEEAFYQKFSDMDSDQSKIWIQKAKAADVNLQEKTLSLKELLDLITEDSIPIVLVDWNKIKKKEGYLGHFVPITGYDEENVYIHNTGLKDYQESMPIPKETFDKARKAKGTDEDIVIITNPTPSSQ